MWEDPNTPCADLSSILHPEAAGPPLTASAPGVLRSPASRFVAGSPSPLLSACHGPHASVPKSASATLFLVTGCPRGLCSRVRSSVPAFRMLLGA